MVISGWRIFPRERRGRTALLCVSEAASNPIFSSNPLFLPFSLSGHPPQLTATCPLLSGGKLFVFSLTRNSLPPPSFYYTAVRCSAGHLKSRKGQFGDSSLIFIPLLPSGAGGRMQVCIIMIMRARKGLWRRERESGAYHAKFGTFCSSPYSLAFDAWACYYPHEAPPPSSAFFVHKGMGFARRSRYRRWEEMPINPNQVFGESRTCRSALPSPGRMLSGPKKRIH